MSDDFFKDAFPFQDNVLTLPVEDLDTAPNWYSQSFGLKEVSRQSEPVPNVIMERGGARIGFAINGEDPTQDGAAILVSNIHQVKDELESNGVETANWRIDERDGKQFQVFFVVAPDGLCYYFHEELSE